MNRASTGLGHKGDQLPGPAWPEISFETCFWRASCPLSGPQFCHEREWTEDTQGFIVTLYGLCPAVYACECA